MDEITDKSIQKNSINLSRNRPVALVVGAAGFLGSSITDKLLEKGIQIVGVDDLSKGRRRNLEEAAKNKDFHLIIEDAQKLVLDLPRLDYVVVATSAGWEVEGVLKILKDKGARCLFISSVDLYHHEVEGEENKWLQKTEGRLARFAHEHKLNARVLRFGPIFGPRMHFRTKDPAVKLIQEALTSSLQKENALDFSTRALYVDDAVDLAIKSLFTGSSAHKIFDGVLPAPIKVEEIKKILLDPLWYETKRFVMEELPPWQTPNLEKTIRFLNWKPKTNIVKALRETLSYFKDNEITPEVKQGVEKVEPSPEWKEEKREVLEQLKGREERIEKTTPIKKDWGVKIPKFRLPLSRIYLVLIISLIVYSLVWPAVSVGWGVLTFRYQLLEAVKNLEKGETEKSLSNLAQAEHGLVGAKTIFESLDPLRKTQVLNPVFEAGDDLSKLATHALTSAKATVLGVEELYLGLKSVTGELADSPKKYLDSSQLHLAQADEEISKAYALLNREGFKQNLPAALKERVDSLEERLAIYRSLVKNGRAISTLLPELIALEGSKNYLVLLQNNSELRPTGGFIGSFAKVNFEGGKLKKLEVNDIYSIDGQLKLQIEPPKEIKSDLGQKYWYLRDSNWEPDFPTSAKQAEWFYNKETGETVDGVVALDVSAIENLLEVVGDIKLSDYNETITSDNLFERAVTHAELSFFPGSQNKKNFLTALANQLFNKLFFLPNQNWPGIVGALGRSLEGKHMSVYLDNPRLFSYIVSQNWASSLPRPTENQDSVFDFLASVEANLGANKSNYYLDRKYNLETVIGKEGDVRHRLRINYINKSPSDTFPAGKYKNRMRVYLPAGTKMNRVVWGETELKDVESFIDYGRAGFSFLLELGPKESKTLVLDYELSQKLIFKDDEAAYRLDVIKQAGTLKDSFEWRVSYPINLKLISTQGDQLNPQEQVISTDLSKDRSFELVFER